MITQKRLQPDTLQNYAITPIFYFDPFDDEIYGTKQAKGQRYLCKCFVWKQILEKEKKGRNPYG